MTCIIYRMAEEYWEGIRSPSYVSWSPNALCANVAVISWINSPDNPKTALSGSVFRNTPWSPRTNASWINCTFEYDCTFSTYPFFGHLLNRRWKFLPQNNWLHVQFFLLETPTNYPHQKLILSVHQNDWHKITVDYSARHWLSPQLYVSPPVYNWNGLAEILMMTSDSVLPYGLNGIVVYIGSSVCTSQMSLTDGQSKSHTFINMYPKILQVQVAVFVKDVVIRSSVLCWQQFAHHIKYAELKHDFAQRIYIYCWWPDYDSNVLSISTKSIDAFGINE